MTAKRKIYIQNVVLPGQYSIEGPPPKMKKKIDKTQNNKSNKIAREEFGPVPKIKKKIGVGDTKCTLSNSPNPNRSAPEIKKKSASVTRKPTNQNSDKSNKDRSKNLGEIIKDYHKSEKKKVQTTSNGAITESNK